MDKHDLKLRENINALIRETDIKKKRMARDLDISIPRLSNILNGNYPFRDIEILKIADYFGVTPNDLYGVNCKTKRKKHTKSLNTSPGGAV